MNSATGLNLEIPRPERTYPSVPPEAPPAPPPSAPSPPPATIYVQQPPKWAYKIIERNLITEAMPGEAELNELGAQGWELAATAIHEQRAILYFKRRQA